MNAIFKLFSFIAGLFRWKRVSQLKKEVPPANLPYSIFNGRFANALANLDSALLPPEEARKSPMDEVFINEKGAITKEESLLFYHLRVLLRSNEEENVEEIKNKLLSLREPLRAFVQKRKQELMSEAIKAGEKNLQDEKKRLLCAHSKLDQAWRALLALIEQ